MWRINSMKFKWYKIPLGTEVEVVNKDSRYFRRKGILASPAPGGAGYCIELENGEADFFCDYEFLPVQNILVLDKLDVETLSQIFNQSYLYETNHVVVYLGKFTNEDIKQAYKNLVEQLASGECKYSKAEYVLALLNEMQKYDAEAIEDPIGEMITFIQWWVEGLRNHVTKDMKDKRYFETEHFKIDFIELD